VSLFTLSRPAPFFSLSAGHHGGIAQETTNNGRDEHSEGDGEEETERAKGMNRRSWFSRNTRRIRAIFVVVFGLYLFVASLIGYELTQGHQGWTTRTDILGQQAAAGAIVTLLGLVLSYRAFK
jgi:hypothetical protein